MSALNHKTPPDNQAQSIDLQKYYDKNSED